MKERTRVLILAVGLPFVAFLLIGTMLAFSAEKDELQWKARALVAEYQMKQQAFSQAQTDLQTFLKELDAKGLTYKDGMIIEKPKPKPPEKKAEPPKK